MEKVDITRILASTKKRLPVAKNDVAIYVVDIPKAADKIMELVKPTLSLNSAYRRWIKETKRNGGILVGSSIREFFHYYEKVTNDKAI